MKRYTYYPQVVLGAAFSWGMPMAFTAETGGLPATAWLLYIANLLWTVGYDTYYAMTDRDAVEDRVHGLELGADDYLVKPFATRKLETRVRKPPSSKITAKARLPTR